jgi:hypothetical protein
VSDETTIKVLSGPVFIREGSCPFVVEPHWLRLRLPSFLKSLTLRGVILRGWILYAVLAVALVGCRDKRPAAPTVGTYGGISNVPSAKAAPALPDRSAQQPWTNGALSIIHTELSPATLCHSTSKTISFFANMPATGIGGPTFVAMRTQQGPKIFRHGEVIDPARMRDSWFVVWWAGATNWTNWDSPWFLTLQHRPQKIEFDTNGLHFTFNSEAGYAALMPLYGYYKPTLGSPEGAPFALLKEKKKRVLTWEWHKALASDALARAMYWASALKEFPVYCEDSFSIDREHDSVIVRQKFRFISWDDDWQTQHVKLAPVSPVLALAVQNAFPAEFSKKPDDMEIFTPFGPLYGVDGVDEYTVTLPVLRYVNETAGAGTGPGMSNAPCFAAWRESHASANWEALSVRWPELWKSVRNEAAGSWAAFGPGHAGSLLENTVNALGAARIAYRLGDAGHYAQASQLFARGMVQLCAQRRGLKYFHGNLPWHSMELLTTNGMLGRITSTGWMAEQGGAPPNFAEAPDVARLWREAGPANPTSATTAPLAYERLIPGGPAWPFQTGGESFAAESNTFLIAKFDPQTFSYTWPQWKTPAGAAWNFGQITISGKPAKVQSIPLNWNSTVTTVVR